MPKIFDAKARKAIDEICNTLRKGVLKNKDDYKARRQAAKGLKEAGGFESPNVAE